MGSHVSWQCLTFGLSKQCPSGYLFTGIAAVEGFGNRGRPGARSPRVFLNMNLVELSGNWLRPRGLLDGYLRGRDSGLREDEDGTDPKGTPRWSERQNPESAIADLSSLLYLIGMGLVLLEVPAHTNSFY